MPATFSFKAVDGSSTFSNTTFTVEEVKLSSGKFMPSLILGHRIPRATMINPIVNLVESFMT